MSSAVTPSFRSCITNWWSPSPSSDFLTSLASKSHGNEDHVLVERKARIIAFCDCLSCSYCHRVLLGRTHVKTVAETRKSELDHFLNKLLQLASEISEVSSFAPLHHNELLVRLQLNMVLAFSSSSMT